MKFKLLIFLFLSGIYLSSSAQSSWIQQNSGITDALEAVYFVNSQTGFVGGFFNNCLKTTNAGLNWVQIGDTSLRTTRSIYFFDSNTGLCVGTGLHRTTNSGTNWYRPSYPSDANSICFINSTTGFGCGSGTNQIIKTTDAGNNWTVLLSLPSVESYVLESITFPTSDAGYACGYKNSPAYIGTILRSSDGGANWIPCTLPSASTFLYSVFFVNANTGFAGGDLNNTSGVLFKTTDAGVTWVNISTTLSSNVILSIYFNNANTGYIAAKGLNIYKTTNGGLSFFPQNISSSSINLNQIQFTSLDTGYVVANGGRIFKTIRGGVKIETLSSIIPDKYSLSQNYPNPFNPATTINFQIPKNDFINLKVYDINGREISELVNESLQAGEYKVNFDASALPSGVYYYKLSSENFSETMKMILIK